MDDIAKEYDPQRAQERHGSQGIKYPRVNEVWHIKGESQVHSLLDERMDRR